MNSARPRCSVSSVQSDEAGGALVVREYRRADLGSVERMRAHAVRIGKQNSIPLARLKAFQRE